jgi:heme-degrading monooxygenase HmoA
MFMECSMIARVFRYGRKPGADSGAHDETAKEAHRVLSAKAGFVARLLATGVDNPGDYVDVVIWASPEQARASSSAAARDEAVRTWLEHIDEPSVKAWSVKTIAAVSRAPAALADPAVGAWLLVRWRIRAGVDVVEHMRNEVAIQHESFGLLPGYLGAYSMHEMDGRECMSLSAWANVESAKAGVERVLRQEDELLTKHMADCEPEASIEYFAPLLLA